MYTDSCIRVSMPTRSHVDRSRQVPLDASSFEVMSAFALRNGARDRGVVTWNFDPGIERIKSLRSYRNAEKQLLSLSSEG